MSLYLVNTQTSKPPCETTHDSLTDVEERRAGTILANAARTVLAKVLNGEYRALHSAAFEEAIKRQCNTIFRAAKTRPKKPWSQKERLVAERKAARKALADEMRTERVRLKTMSQKFINAERDLAALHARLCASNPTAGYPAVPPPSIVPHREGLNLPTEPGIYFLWLGDTIDYVGQSVRLSHRLRLGLHHVLKEDYLISYVLLEKRLLTWAECYYIGLLRPIRNFGDSAYHNKVDRVGI